jgi:hypothetical protein
MWSSVRRLLTACLFLWFVSHLETAYADFALRDKDTVVFLGDSITAARTYGKIIENYTLLRYPNRRVRFINAGWGGDTAAGGLKRLDRDVFARGATVLTVAYGVNDIGWGVRAVAEHKKLYLDSFRSIVAHCRERHVRVYICSAAITAEDPATADTGFCVAANLGAQQFRFIPIPDELDRYMLAIKGLAPGRYDLLVDDRRLGAFSSEQLAAGVNICSATADGWEPGGPWDAEAAALIPLTEARSNLADVVRQTDYYLQAFPAQSSVHRQTDASILRIEALQRTLVKPRPFHFVVRSTGKTS